MSENVSVYHAGKKKSPSVIELDLTLKDKTEDVRILITEGKKNSFDHDTYYT